MNCIIVDDESLAHDVIEEYISRIPFLNLVQNCYDIQEAVEAMRRYEVDLIFLDISLPGITGIEFLKSTRKLPHVIICTAYDNCAVQGFEMDVIDYLLKPFSFERFLKANYKSYNIQQQQHQLEARENRPLRESFIFVRTNSEDVKIDLKSIIRINALKDYVIIYTADRKLIIHLTMRAVMEKISSENFIRVHNSHIVSLRHIQSIGKNFLTIGNEKIPVSEKYKPYLANIIDQYK